MSGVLIFATRKDTIEEIATSRGAFHASGQSDIPDMIEVLRQGGVAVANMNALNTGYRIPAEAQIEFHPECPLDSPERLQAETRQADRNLDTVKVSSPFSMDHIQSLDRGLRADGVRTPEIRYLTDILESRLPTQSREAEEALGLSWNDDTRFSLRLEYYPEWSHDADAKVAFIKDIRSLKEAQCAYLQAVSDADLGASRFLPGEVFDQDGAHVARISYNGRLWRPEPLETEFLRPDEKPVAEAPEFVPDRRADRNLEDGLSF